MMLTSGRVREREQEQVQWLSTRSTNQWEIGARFKLVILGAGRKVKVA